MALRKGSLVVNSSQGGGSKDTWVLQTEGDINAFTGRRQSLLDEPLFRAGYSLLARSGSELQLDAESWQASTEQRWQSHWHMGLGGSRIVDRPASRPPQAHVRSGDQFFHRFLHHQRARNASQVREQISSEMWEGLNQLYHEVMQTAGIHEATPMSALFSAIREGVYKFSGVTDASMNHGEAWQFIQLGKYMERTSALPALLDAVYSTSEGADDLDWVGLLPVVRHLRRTARSTPPICSRDASPSSCC